MNSLLLVVLLALFLCRSTFAWSMRDHLSIRGRKNFGLSAVSWFSFSSSTTNSDEDGISDFPGGTSSTWQGAGVPRVELEPSEIPSLLMKALQRNDIPDVNSGLKSMWEFAGGNTQYLFEYNRTDFIDSAHETADQWPTSFYGNALYGQHWEMETEINRVGGHNGWIATQVMKTISSDGRMRRWQWELRQNRRPPNQGVWLVESIGSSDRKGNFEPDG